MEQGARHSCRDGGLNNDVEAVLQLDNLAALEGVAHGFESRWGELGSVTGSSAVRVHQVHGSEVIALPEDRGAWDRFRGADPQTRPPADALITDHEEVTVAVSVADCLPILIADPERRAVGAVHGGWRCLAGGIVENAIQAMTRTFDTNPRDLVVGIGPGIRPCCFEVGSEVIDAFAAAGYAEAARVAAQSTAAKPYCDLAAVARAQAVRSGVPDSAVADLGLCTRCNNEWFWSFRADGDAAGRMLCGIALTTLA